MCKLCKVLPRKSDRIVFCPGCKTKIDNLRNTLKNQNRLQEFTEAYSGPVENLQKLVDEDVAKSIRPDGRSGRGLPRVQWDYAAYGVQ